MKGCILAGRFVVSNADKNTTRALRKTRSGRAGAPSKARDKT